MRRLAVASTVLLALLAQGTLLAQPEIDAFGDSVTLGALPYDDMGGYPARLQQLLRSEGVKGVVVRNHGLGGESTSEALSRVDGVLAEGGDTFIFMEGTNDVGAVWDGLISFETTIFNIQEILNRAERRGYETIFSTIIPRSPRALKDRTNDLTFELVLEIRELGSRGDRMFADMWNTLASERRYFERFYYQGKDPVGHPNPEGFDLLAAKFADTYQGRDTTSPVFGPFEEPGFDAARIEPDATLRMVLFDHQTGIDRKNTYFLVNEEAVDTEITGGKRRSELVHELEGNDLGCLVTIGVHAQDQNDPPNVLEITLGEYLVEGIEVLDADLNIDCRVDGTDLVDFAIHFGAERGLPRYDSVYDFNDDGVIDGEDLAVVASQFGQSAA